MATVWSALDPNRRPVAVKLLDRRFASDLRVRAAFQREVRSMARLDHPNIVRILDYGQRDDAQAQPFLAMELLNGGSLLEGHQPSSWIEARALFRQILDALAHAHARGVIHRDIKPSNVMFGALSDSRPGLKLTDFGIAKASRGDHEFRTGTPRYMAPEQFRDERDVGPWTDLYATGVMMWEILTGRAPFDGAGPEALAHQHAFADLPEFRPRFPVPADVAGLLLRLLAKRPEDRYRFAADVAYALESLEGEMLLPSALPAAIPVDDATIELDFALDREEATWTELPEVHAEIPLPARPSAITPAPLPSRWTRGIGPRPAASAHRPSPKLATLRDPPLFGRDDVCDVLWDALRDVSDTRSPQVVVLRGPPDVGRARLVRWLKVRLHELGAAEVLFARDRVDSSGISALEQMLDGYFHAEGMGPEEHALRIRRKIVAAPWGGTDLAPTVLRLLDPRLSPTERIELIVRVLRRFSSARPVALLFEGIVHNDNAVELLHELGRIAGLPVLAVAVPREEELAAYPRLRRRVEELETLDHVTTLEIRPMGYVPLVDLLRQQFGLRPALATRVARRAAGRPGVALGILRELAAAEGLRQTSDGLDLKPGVRLPRDAAADRMWRDALADFVGELAPLEIAALLGQHVQASAWRDACSAAGVAWSSDLLFHAEAAGWLESQGDTWVFPDAALRDVLHERTRRAGREHRWALACAEAVSSPVFRGRLFLIAGRPLDAADAFIEGVRIALSREDVGAAEEAADAAHDALDECELPDDDPRRLETLLLHARLHLRQHELQEAAELARSVLRESFSNRDARRVLAEVAFARGEVRTAAARLAPILKDDPAVEDRLFHTEVLVRSGLHKQAKLELQKLDPSELTLRQHGTGLRIRGDLERQLARLDESYEAYREAYKVARTAHYGAGITSALQGLAECQRHAGAPEVARDLYLRCIRQRTTLGLDSSISWLNITLCWLESGSPAEALRVLDAVSETLNSQGKRVWAAVGDLIRLWSLATEGLWADWAGIVERAQSALLTSGLVDIDVARVATMAGRMAFEAGQLGPADLTLGLAESQWDALGQRERADETRRLRASIASKKTPPLSGSGRVD